MDSMVEIYFDRASNELLAAESLKRLSEDSKAKEEFNLPQKTTFYSSVISHSYYAVFYAAKAILLTKRIKTDAPNVHKKTYDEFKRVFVDTGMLDMKLLDIYKEMVIKADDLLQIYKDSKWKRGKFTYKTIPQANKEPAEESIRHAGIFISNIGKVLRSR
mgnify:CR=1 FL=1